MVIQTEHHHISWWVHISVTSETYTDSKQKVGLEMYTGRLRLEQTLLFKRPGFGPEYDTEDTRWEWYPQFAMFQDIPDEKDLIELDGHQRDLIGLDDARLTNPNARSKDFRIW